MGELDENFPAVRKNLNILSVLILIMAFSNAEINKINFLGIDLELEGDKFYMGLYVVYLYFIWRFLTKLKLKSVFLIGFREYLHNGETGLRKFLDIKQLKEKYFPDLNVDTGIELKYIVLKSSNTFKNEYELRFNINSRDEKYNQYQNQKVVKSIFISKFLIVRILIWYCIKHDRFGDHLFPFVPILMNLCFFIFSKEWQGGIYQLLSG